MDILFPSIIGTQGYTPQAARESLQEQLFWMIRLRWLAVLTIVLGAFLSTRIFAVLETGRPIYICAGILFAANLVYYFLSNPRFSTNNQRQLRFAIIQIEFDLVILTILLHFSGGVLNPFAMFYIFHIVIATIILSRPLSFGMALSAIALYGLMAFGEVKGWRWLGHTSLQLTATGSLWQNPLYVLWIFGAFGITLILTRHLTLVVLSRMQAQEIEAAQTRDVLTAVINAMTEGLIFLNAQGEITFCNRTARLWRRKDSLESVEVTANQFPGPLADHLKTIMNQDGSSPVIPETLTFEFGEEETHYIEATSCPVQGAHQHLLGYVIVGQDLTKRRCLENDLVTRSEEVTKINEMLRKSQIEMAQRERMVAIGQMASGIAHEIGNPLASLSSVAQYLARKLTDAQAKDQLGLIERQVQRISQILRCLLGLSRPASNESTWTDINQMIEDSLSLVRYDKRARSVEIRSIANPDLPTVWITPSNLEQVLINIFLNALDALAGADTQAHPKLEISREKVEDRILIRIQDNGVGIPQEVQEHIFEPFFTTKQQAHGTGLGLYISRNLMEELGGSLTVTSKINQGTNVEISLPIRLGHTLVTVSENKDENSTRIYLKSYGEKKNQ
jgi:signal transduction histidine kinase